MIRAFIHILLHFLIPAAVAQGIRKRFDHSWIKLWLTLIAANLIDLDHLLSETVYDPNRCSIGFHLLHSYWAIGIYLLLIPFKKTRIIGIGLIVHILLDTIDCMMM